MASEPDTTQEIDEALADVLATTWPTMTAADGSRRTWDPVAGLWQDDKALVRNVRARAGRREVLGSDRDARNMNGYGL